jgi:hypothetical protein
VIAANGRKEDKEAAPTRGFVLTGLKVSATAAPHAGSLANMRQIVPGMIPHADDSDDGFPTAFQCPMLEGMDEGGDWSLA